MCIFTGPIDDVSNTRIFTRCDGDRQYVVYEMRFASAADNAMILPLPVKRNGSEDAVRFINLEKYTSLFADLNMLFEATGMLGDLATPVAAMPKSLKVHSVGAFDASYVPTRADFSRLDPRFHLTSDVWDGLPGYQDYGFAVFKLKASEGVQVHPMAFDFPTRDPARLFFPTVHVHRGKVVGLAQFDHSLYCQAYAELPDPWNRSGMAAGDSVDVGRTEGIVLDRQHVYRMKMAGLLENVDVWVPNPTETASV